MISSFKIPQDASVEEKLMMQYSINKQLINELKKQNFALGQMQSLKDEVEDLRNDSQVSFLKRKLKELEGKLREKNEKLKIANKEISELTKNQRKLNRTFKDEHYIFVLETYLKEMGLWANFKVWLNNQ